MFFSLHYMQYFGTTGNESFNQQNLSLPAAFPTRYRIYPSAFDILELTALYHWPHKVCAFLHGGVEAGLFLCFCQHYRGLCLGILRVVHSLN